MLHACVIVIKKRDMLLILGN